MLLTQRAAAQAREPGLELSVGARSTQGRLRSEQVASLTLTVPLDALAQPASPRVAPVAEPPAAQPVTPALPESSSLELSFEQLRELSKLSSRATAVALAAAGVPEERRRLDGMSARARASAALPELKLRAQRNTDQALRWAPTNDDPYRVTQADGAGTTLEVSATFHLDRLVFAREELVVERQRQKAASEHLALERRVAEQVRGLFRARQLACAEGADLEQRAQQLLRIAEHASELDSLTAGWFVDQAPRVSTALWGFPEAILGQCRAPEPEPTKPVARAENSG